MRSHTAISAYRSVRNDGVIPSFRKGIARLAVRAPAGDRMLRWLSKRDIQKRMRSEATLADIVHTAVQIRPGFPPYQLRAGQLDDEIYQLAEIVAAARPRTVLEIGTSMGGSLYIWSRHLKSVTRLISLDLPEGRFGGGYSQAMADLFRTFTDPKESHFLRCDSHSADSFKRVVELSGGRIDYLFIDGDHTYKGVKQDFEMYSPLVPSGGIIALHDIVSHPADPREVVWRQDNVQGVEPRHLLWSSDSGDCKVDRFWRELADIYRTREIISHPLQTWAGIGVISV